MDHYLAIDSSPSLLWRNHQMMDQNQTFLFLVLMTRLRISKLYAMMLKVFIRELQEMIWF